MNSIDVVVRTQFYKLYGKSFARMLLVMIYSVAHVSSGLASASFASSVFCKVKMRTEFSDSLLSTYVPTPRH